MHNLQLPFSTDEEAAASKRMVVYAFSAQINLFTSFFIKQPLRNTVFILFPFMLQEMKPTLCDRKFSMPIKNRVLQTFVWPVILYGSESWTLDAKTRKNIEAAEMWVYKRMLKISLVERVTNDEVLNRVQRERQPLQRIAHDQNKFLGHIIRMSFSPQMSFVFLRHAMRPSPQIVGSVA